MARPKGFERSRCESAVGQGTEERRTKEREESNRLRFCRIDVRSGSTLDGGGPEDRDHES